MHSQLVIIVVVITIVVIVKEAIIVLITVTLTMVMSPGSMIIKVVINIIIVTHLPFEIARPPPVQIKSVISLSIDYLLAHDFR